MGEDRIEPPPSLSLRGWLEVLSLGWPSRLGVLSLGMWAAFHLELFVLEPGYYEDGAFGIRIENVVLVVPAKTKVSIHIIFLQVFCCYYGKTNAFEPWWGQNGAFFPPYRDFTRSFFPLQRRGQRM